MLMFPYLNKHLALGSCFDRSAVDGHGLAVTGELQSELLLHQLPDYLTATAEDGGK